MFSFTKPYAVGLDIGQSTVKAVALVSDGRKVSVADTRILDCRAEGILDVSELRAQLPKWLKEAGWRKRELTVGLPQYLAATQVVEFPPGSDQSLESMVAYETQQLAGLSEEQFVHGHCLMSAAATEGKNRVLIGACRHSVVTERAETLLSADLQLADFGIPGVALANAYFDLYPEALPATDPQLLLDIGTESSTLVVVAKGQLAFVGSLLFGSVRFTQALAKQLGVSDDEAEKAKLNSRYDPGDPSSPLAPATRALETELRTAIEHWRKQERSEIAGLGFARLCLSGGGALLHGLGPYLGRVFGCAAEVVGVPRGNGGERDSRLMIAYGLALQGLHVPAVSISLAPPEMRWLVQRRRSFKYLAVATVLLVATLVLISVWMRYDLVEKQKEIRNTLGELGRCDQLIPQLEDVIAETTHRERMLVPLVAKGNRAHRVLAGIEALSAARGKDDWFIYLADNQSYRENVGKDPTGKDLGGEKKGSSTADGVPITPMLPLGGDIGVPNMPPEFPNRVLSTDVQPLQSLIVAGYTPLRYPEPYKPVRDIVEKLNKTADRTLFANVDLLPENERVEREDIFQPWVQLFKDRADVRYKAFTLRVPFATLDVLSELKEVKKPK